MKGLRHRDVLLHAVPLDHNLAVILFGQPNQLLDAREKRREGCRNDPAGSRFKNFFKRFLHLRFGNLVSWHFGIRALRDQEQDALPAEVREPRNIGRALIDRRMVEFEVAGVDHRTDRGFEHHADAVGNVVVDVEKFHPKGTQRHLRFRGHDMDLGLAHLAEILLALEDDAAGQGRRIDRRVAEGVKQMRDRADVVVVAVGNDNAADILAPRPEVFDVRDEVVNPRHIFIGELQPHVHNYDVVFVLVDVAGAGYFSATAKRDKAQLPLLDFWKVRFKRVHTGGMAAGVGAGPRPARFTRGRRRAWRDCRKIHTV